MAKKAKTTLPQFLILFLGAAVAIVLGNSLYYSILSVTDNVLIPTIIKIIDWLNIVDTSDWDYKEYHWIEFLGDIMTFTIAVLIGYFIFIQVNTKPMKIHLAKN